MDKQDKIFLWVIGFALAALIFLAIVSVFSGCVTQTVNIGSPQHNPELEIDPTTEFIKQTNFPDSVLMKE